MTDRRKPENAELRKQWVTLTAYAELYDVDPRTVKKWADAGLVDLVEVRPANARTIIRVKNQRPRQHAGQDISRTTS
jgi:hypothetical protein